MTQRRLFVPFTKIDEEKREVWGRLTQEIVDRDGEMWDYDASVPHTKAWSEGFEAATGGKSKGNLRAMHQPISAGKLIAIDYDDVEKSVEIGTKIVDDKEWEKTLEGLYTGFSIGGRVVRSWRNPNEKFKRFEIRPIEASLADLPCVPTATFTYVKVGGIKETRHFTKTSETPMPNAAKPTQFADVANRRFPIDTVSMARLSIAAWGKTAAREKCTDTERAAIGANLLQAAKTHGIEGITEPMLAGAAYTKDLYHVSRMADLISSLVYLQQSTAYEQEYEGDESQVPANITDAIAALLSTLSTMIDEEGDEILRMLGFTVVEGTSESAAAAETTKAATPAEAAAVVTAPAPAAAAATSTGAAPAAVAASASAAGESAAVAASVEKVAAPETTKAHTKKHVAELTDLQDSAKVCMKIMSDHYDKLAGMIGSADSSDDDASSKVAGAEVEKITGQLAEWQKRAEKAESELLEATTKLTAATAERDDFKTKAEQLATAGEQLTAALETRKGKLIAVDRSTDGQAALSTKTATPAAPTPAEPRAEVKPGEVDQDAFKSTMKATFLKPIGPGLRPLREIAKT